MKSQSSQETTDYLSRIHMFTSTPNETPISSSEQDRKPPLRNIFAAYKARKNKAYTTTVNTKEILHNVSDFSESNSLKNNSAIDNLEMNNEENNSRFGSLTKKNGFDYNSTHKNNLTHTDGNKQIHITKSFKKLKMIREYRGLTGSLVTRQINHSLLGSSTTNFRVSINSVSTLSLANKLADINNKTPIISDKISGSSSYKLPLYEYSTVTVPVLVSNLPEMLPIDVSKKPKQLSNRKVRRISKEENKSKNKLKRNNNVFILIGTGQHQQTEAINIGKTTDIGSTVHYFSSTKNPVSLKSVEEEDKELFVLQKSTDSSTHRTHNSLDSKEYHVHRQMKKEETEKLLTNNKKYFNKNRKKKNKQKIKTNRIRNKSFNVTNKEENGYLKDITTSTEFHRGSSTTNELEEKGDYRKSSKKDETGQFTRDSSLSPERENQKPTSNAEKQQKVNPFKQKLIHKEHFQHDATFLPKLLFHNSRHVNSTTKQTPKNEIKEQFSFVSPFGLMRRTNRKWKPHSLNEHDHFQTIIRNDDSLSGTNSEMKITVKRTFLNLTPPIVTTIRNVLNTRKEKYISTLQNVSDNFEVSKLLSTTQSESVLKNIDNQYDPRINQNIKQPDVTMLPLTKILNENNLERTTIIPRNIKELSETDAKQTNLDKNQSIYTTKRKHKKVTKSTDDRTKWILSEENLKRTSFFPSKISADSNDHLLNRDSDVQKLISTADYQHLRSFENSVTKQKFKSSVIDSDANLKRNSSIQFKTSTPLNLDVIDEIQASHENFPSKSSPNLFFISETSTSPTIYSGKGASLRPLYKNTKKKMKKSKIIRKEFTTPEIELIYQTMNPKYSSSIYLWQSTPQSETDHKHVASQKDIYSDDRKKFLSTLMPPNIPTEIPENVSLLLGLVPQSSTIRSGNYKSKMASNTTVATSSQRSNEENKSSVTVNYIKDFTQTSISEKSEVISLENMNENKYSYSVNSTHESYNHPSTSSIPRRPFHFPLDFDNSASSKSIVDKKHTVSQISPTTTSNTKTSGHTILTPKYDTSVPTTKSPMYSQDALVSTRMTTGRHRMPPSHTISTSQLPFQTTMMPIFKISPITREISTQSISTKVTKMVRQTFPKLNSKVIVEHASLPTDNMSTQHKQSFINKILNQHTSNNAAKISSTPHLKYLSTRHTPHFSIQHTSYLTKIFSKRHTTPQTTKISTQRTPFLITKSSTREIPPLTATLPTQHTPSITRNISTPSATISKRNTKSQTMKLSSRPMSIATSKFSTPHISSRKFPNLFITTIVTWKTHKTNGSIQSEDTQRSTHHDSTSMTETTEHLSKDSRVPTPNTPSLNSVTPLQKSDSTPLQESVTTPSQESDSTPLQESDSTPSQESDSTPSSKDYQRLLVVCKVDTSVNIDSDQFQNNIRNGLVKSYIEGKALGEVSKSGSMKKRRKHSIDETSDQVHRINEIKLSKCVDGCKTESEIVKAVIIRQVRRDTLVSIYFQMQENGVIVEAEKAAEIFARLQLTEISVHLKYAIFEKVRSIKILLPQSQHPLKSSSTKWMMITIAAPSIPVLCVIFILLSSWYRNHTRLRQKAMADISRGSGYTESLADVGLEIDMEKGEIVSRAGSTSVLWSEDFIASATKGTNSHADYFAAECESSRSNSWSAYADPNNVFNSLRNKKQSPIPKRFQRQGKYAKKHSVSSFNFETGLEDECSPIYESFKPMLGRYKCPYTSTMQSNVSCGRLAKEQQRQNDTSTSKACSETSGQSQMLRLSLHANIISQFLAELENM